MSKVSSTPHTPAQKLREINPKKVKDTWLIAVTDPVTGESFKLDRPNFKKAYGLENTIHDSK